MKNWMTYSLAGAGLVGAGAGLSFLAATANWNAETARIAEKLRQSASAAAKAFSFKDLDGLPAPVARYFRFALKEGQPFIRAARVRHAGQFKLGDQWVPFQSTQHFSSTPPGFVWDAKMRMSPWLSVRVRDGYSGGKGSMLAKIFALFPVADADSRDQELAAGALQRYLAESVWQPTALLPSEKLSWAAMENNRASATLTDAGVTVSLEFSFAETGEIAGIFSPARFYESGGEYRLFPWAGRFWNYAERDGMKIPPEGEVEWHLPEGKVPYWRGRVIEAEYELTG